MNEEIVVILDANKSMGEDIHRLSKTDDDDDDDSMMASAGDFLGTTKFDVACYIVQALLQKSASTWSPGMNHIRVLALVTLGQGESVSKPKSLEDRGKIETWDGCSCYSTSEIDHKTSADWLQDIVEKMYHSRRKSQEDSDFVTGILLAANAMLRNTTVGAGRRRIVLLTDARHKVLVAKDDTEDTMEPLVDAVNELRGVGCTLEVVGMGFREDGNRSEASGADSDSEMETDGESSESDSDVEDDWLHVQEQNELLIFDLVEKLVGSVQAVNFGTSMEDGYCIERVLKQLE